MGRRIGSSAVNQKHCGGEHQQRGHEEAGAQGVHRLESNLLLCRSQFQSFTYRVASSATNSITTLVNSELIGGCSPSVVSEAPSMILSSVVSLELLPAGRLSSWTL